MEIDHFRDLLFVAESFDRLFDAAPSMADREDLRYERFGTD